MYKPSASFYKEFTTATPSTGAAANADSLPVATANHNGTDDGSFALTVTNIDTGRYKITGTVPSGYVKGDVVNVSVAATCSGVAGKAIVDTFTIDSLYIGDLNNLAAGAAMTLTSGERTALSGVILSDTSDTLGADIVTILNRIPGTVAQSSQLPANFGALGITAGGKVSEVALCDVLTTYTNNTPQSGDLFAVVNPMVTSHVFTSPALANAPTGGGPGLSTVLNSPRTLDAVPDGSITFNDALWCAVVGAAGKEGPLSGTSFPIKTPSTGTVLRTFTVDTATATANPGAARS